MPLIDYCERYTVYRREFDDVDSTNVFWKRNGYIMAAITHSRNTEIGESGRRDGGQVAGVEERYALYIPYEDTGKLPGLDDFVKNDGNGETYRVMTDPMVRRTPNRAVNRFCVCEIVKAKIPERGGYNE
jgi:hypothetical protein